MARDARKQQCTAKAKRTGERCKRWAVTGYTVCQVHGAGSPFKGRPGGRPPIHGRYSKHLPRRLAGRYKEALEDQELLSLRSEAALIYSRLTEVLKRVYTGESGKLWRDLRATLDKFEKAREEEDEVIASGTLAELSSLIERGYSDYVAWDEVRQLVEDLRRIVESERRRILEAHQVLTVQQANALVAVLLEAIKKHIDDPTTLAAIGAELTRIYGLFTSERVGIQPGS